MPKKTAPKRIEKKANRQQTRAFDAVSAKALLVAIRFKTIDAPSDAASSISQSPAKKQIPCLLARHRAAAKALRAAGTGRAL